MVSGTYAAHVDEPRLGFDGSFSIETLTFSVLSLVLLVVSYVSGIAGVGIFAAFCAIAAAGFFVAHSTMTAPTE